MITYNWAAILATGIIPLLVGVVYYHPKVLGASSARAAGFSESEMAQRHSPKVYVYTLLFGLLLAMFLMPVVIHALHIFSMVAQPGGGPVDPASPSGVDGIAFFEKYGHNFRTFKHGAFHGILAALFGVWPVLGVIALSERRGWKYIAIHLGYWVLVFALMGGAVCAFG